jgi:hypothetical protein
MEWLSLACDVLEHLNRGCDVNDLAYVVEVDGDSVTIADDSGDTATFNIHLIDGHRYVIVPRSK